jgi:hypothetical protein
MKVECRTGAQDPWQKVSERIYTVRILERYIPDYDVNAFLDVTNIDHSAKSYKDVMGRYSDLSQHWSDCNCNSIQSGCHDHFSDFCKGQVDMY